MVIQVPVPWAYNYLTLSRKLNECGKHRREVERGMDKKRNVQDNYQVYRAIKENRRWFTAADPGDPLERGAADNGLAGPGAVGSNGRT